MTRLHACILLVLVRPTKIELLIGLLDFIFSTLLKNIYITGVRMNRIGRKSFEFEFFFFKSDDLFKIMKLRQLEKCFMF